MLDVALLGAVVTLLPPRFWVLPSEFTRTILVVLLPFASVVTTAFILIVRLVSFVGEVGVSGVAGVEVVSGVVDVGDGTDSVGVVISVVTGDGALPSKVPTNPNSWF